MITAGATSAERGPHPCSEHFRTLCSACAKCTDLRLCPWTGQPETAPPGAQIEGQILKASGKAYMSYAVVKCSNFERGRARSADDPAPARKPEAVAVREAKPKDSRIRAAVSAVESPAAAAEPKPKRKYAKRSRTAERIRDKEYDEWRMLIPIMGVAYL